MQTIKQRYAKSVRGNLQGFNTKNRRSAAHNAKERGHLTNSLFFSLLGFHLQLRCNSVLAEQIQKGMWW